LKTLPDAITTGKVGDSERVILFRIVPEAGDSWTEFLWATRDITITAWEGGAGTKVFVGNMLAEKKLGKISQSVDIEKGGNIAKVSGLTIRIINPEYSGSNRFDQSFASYNLENRTCEIYLAFWTGSNPAWSDILRLHTFLIDDVSFDYGEYEIKLRDAGLKRHKTIPDLVLNLNDYPALPETNKGCVIPLLYGQMCDGVFGYGNNSFAPMFLADKNKRIYLASRNQSVNVGDGSMVYLFLNAVNRFGQILPVSGSYSSTYTRPTKLEFPLGTEFKGRLRSQCHGQGSQTSPTSMSLTNATDDDDTTYLTIGNNEKLYLKPILPSMFGKWVGVLGDLVLYIQFGTRTGNGATVKRYNTETAVFTTLGTAPAGVPSLLSFSLGTLESGDLDAISLYEFGIECDASSTAQVDTMYFYFQGYLLQGEWFKYTTQINEKSGQRERVLVEQGVVEWEQRDKLYVDAKGEQYGSAIGGRGNGRFSTAIAEYGAYIIELILRSELGLGDSQINVTAFDGIGNTTNGTRKDWKFANIVDRQSLSLNIIKDFCEQCAIAYFVNYENKESLFALKNSTPVKTIDRTTIQEGGIKPIGFSDLKNTYNEFYVQYRKNNIDAFARTLFLTASNHNLSSNVRGGTPATYTGLCADSQTKYNFTQRLTLDCNWIRDDATAELLIKWLTEWFCFRKCIVEFESAGLDHIELELGDQINFDHTLVTSGGAQMGG